MGLLWTSYHAVRIIEGFMRSQRIEPIVYILFQFNLVSWPGDDETLDSDL